MDPKSNDEIEAEKAAAEYFKQNHPELEEGKTFYSGVVEDQNKSVEEPKKAEENLSLSDLEKLVIGAGAGAGAYATHKDLVSPYLNKAFKGSNRTYGLEEKPSQLLPNEVTSFNPKQDTHVDKVVQSIPKKENGFGTGRQREDAQHLKSNRQAILLEEARKNPNFNQAIIEGGEMYPTRGGIAIPVHRAEEMAVEEANKIAQATKTASNLGKVSGVARVGVGALGGALGAKDIYDVYEKYKHNEPLTEEDYLKIAGGAGGILSTIPTPLTEGAGLAIAGGALAYPYIKRALTK